MSELQKRLGDGPDAATPFVSRRRVSAASPMRATHLLPARTPPRTSWDPNPAGSRTRTKRVGGQTMSFNHVVDLVARQHDLPFWLAAGIAADVALSQALRAERRHFPRLEKRQNQIAILAHLIEREERTT